MTLSSDTPPGWSYNPSSWSERLWIVGVAGIGLAVGPRLRREASEPHPDSTRAADSSVPTTTVKDGFQLGGAWSHLLVMALGVWLMAAPDVMRYEGPERVVDHIVGPLVASMAVIAMAEVTRPIRWVNVALGLWLMLAPVLIRYDPLHIGARSALIGGAILLLSLVKGPEREHTGGGWRRVWTTPLHANAWEHDQQWKKAG